MTDVSELVARLRSAAKWGTMTSEFAASDRLEWMAADALEAQAREVAELRSRQSCENGQPYVCHALATARSRLADWHRMADERSAEIVRLSTRLAEADALLLMTKWSVLCVAEDAYRAHRLDISDSQYALLNRIDAFRAADSATHQETPVT